MAQRFHGLLIDWMFTSTYGDSESPPETEAAVESVDVDEPYELAEWLEIGEDSPTPKSIWRSTGTCVILEPGIPGLHIFDNDLLQESGDNIEAEITDAKALAEWVEGNVTAERDW